MQRIKNLLLCWDQWMFVLLTLGLAHPDETASAAAWRLELEGRWTGKFWRPVIDKLFFWDDNHCEESFWNEVTHAQLPPVYAELAKRYYLTHTDFSSENLKA
jgi:hypothetical protein